mgnify:CR=1 FL=1
MSADLQMDDNLFAGLVEEHQASLRVFVRSLGVEPDWVDDMAQDAFVVAFREMDSYDPVCDFGKWLRGIARNLVRNELRKAGRRRPLCRHQRHARKRRAAHEFRSGQQHHAAPFDQRVLDAKGDGALARSRQPREPEQGAPLVEELLTMRTGDLAGMPCDVSRFVKDL